MKKLTKKNNKGFSLVELIVVVLIMAIIAVALAPQVTKWVENSRQASDAQLSDSLISACQVLATQASYATGTYTVKVTTTGATCVLGDETSTTESAAFCNALKEIYDVTKAKAKSLTFNVTLKNGVVTSDIAITNSDLK